MSSISEVLGVVVVYNLPLAESKTLSSLSESLTLLNGEMDLLIYDNSPAPLMSSEVHRMFPFTIHYYHNPENPGVGAGYNAGAALAEKLNKKWLLILDQDTSFPNDALKKYVEGIENYQEHNLFAPILSSEAGIYSPSKYYFKRGKIWKNPRPGVHDLKNRMLLNSGLMINLHAFMQVGGYREKIKLYFSDFNFIERFRRRYKQFVALPIVCLHELADLSSLELPSASKRFTHYCEGAFRSVESKQDLMQIWITVFLRAAKLSVRYKSVVFLRLFFVSQRETGNDLK